MIAGDAIATHAIGLPGALFVAPPPDPEPEPGPVLDLDNAGLAFTLTGRHPHFALPPRWAFTLPLRVLHFTLVPDDA